jgi:hypothetical protein
MIKVKVDGEWEEWEPTNLSKCSRLSCPYCNKRKYEHGFISYSEGKYNNYILSDCPNKPKSTYIGDLVDTWRNHIFRREYNYSYSSYRETVGDRKELFCRMTGIDKERYTEIKDMFGMG